MAISITATVLKDRNTVEPQLIPDPIGQSAGVWVNKFNDDFTASKTVTDAANGMVNFGGPTWRAWYPDGGGWAAQANGSHTNNPERELEYYDASGLTATAGVLSLTAYANVQGGLPYTSGLIQSNPSFNFKYGYVEARIKSPQVRTSWPAFWMISSDLVWPPEVDIMEQQSNANSYSVYTSGLSTITNSSIPAYGDRTQFHVWGLKWTATSLAWYIDGTQVGTVTDISRVPQKNMYVVLNHAVDGSVTPLVPSDYPLSMQVDYVRVWQ